MGKTKKEPTPLWLVLTQGSILSLGIYFLGLLGLSALLARGSVGEERSLSMIAGLAVPSSFVGGLAGLAFWESLTFAGKGGLLMACALGGGMLAGLAGRRKPRKGKRVRR